MADVSNPNITSLLNEVSENENITNPKYEVTYNMKKGDGYLSVIYDAKIKGDDGKMLSVITKISPDNKFFREQANIKIVYENEILFYDEIYPAFCKFQKEKGVDLFNFAPKCFLTTLEDEKEALVLENLKDQGYRLWNRMVPMDTNHIELTLKAYAKFHAISFAFKDQCREKFDEYRSKMVDIFEKFADNQVHKELLENVTQNTVISFENECDKEYFEKFKKYLESMGEVGVRFFSKNADDYGVIIHGDCWCNNIMYKYDQVNPSIPTEIRFIDYQVIRYSSPITDFTHFFYTSSTKEQQDNIEYYKDLYYNTLTDFIKKLGSDPEKLYPRSVFDSHWKMYCVNGLNVAIFLIKMMSVESDEIPDYEDLEGAKNFVNHEPKNNEYKKRIRDVVIHFCEKGYI